MKKKILFCVGGILILLGVIGITTFYYAQIQDQGVSKKNSDHKQEEIIKLQLTKDEEYLHNLSSDIQKLHDDFQAHDFLNANMSQDGPNFEQTFAYLQEAQVTYDDINQKVEDYLNEDHIHQRASDLNLYDEDADVYQNQVEKAFSSLKKNYQSNLPLQITALTDIFVFLKDRQDRWALQEKGIIFDSQGDMEEYRHLLGVLDNVPLEVSYD